MFLEKLSSGTPITSANIRDQLIDDGAVFVDGSKFIPNLIAIVDTMAVYCQNEQDWETYKLFVTNWLAYPTASHL